MNSDLLRCKALLGPCICATALVVAACSKTRYQSLDDGGFAGWVKANQRWQVELPYRSSKNLVIERASRHEVLASDKRWNFHVTRIPMGAEGYPGMPVHGEFKYGDFCKLLGDTQILIVGDRNAETKVVTLADAKSLAPQFSTELSFSKAEDVTLPGLLFLRNVVFLFQTSVEIKKEYWSAAGSQYVIPYVASLKYDLHVLNRDAHKVLSVSGLDGASLEGLKDTLASAKDAAVEEVKLQTDKFALGASRVFDRYVYELQDFYLTEHDRVVVFSVQNYRGDKFYYSVDLEDTSKPPKVSSKGKYWSTYLEEPAQRDAKDEMRDTVVTISGKRYHVERTGHVPSGLVVVGWEHADADGEMPTKKRVVIGIRQTTPGGPREKAWEYPLRYEGQIGELTEDPIRNAVYFPDVGEDKKFKVQGLAAVDGRAFEAFPANFKVTLKENGEPGEVSMVGTSADFNKQTLYLHDCSNNRIVCANLQGGGEAGK